MRRLITLDQTVPVIFYVIMVGSVYMLFAGHNQPGGGFVAGLVAGAAMSLKYIAGGIDEVRRASRLKPWTVLGLGILIAAADAVVPVLLGRPVLQSGYYAPEAAVLGKVSISSALVFDIGVYICVVGLVQMVFEAFGDRFKAER